MRRNPSQQIHMIVLNLAFNANRRIHRMITMIRMMELTVWLARHGRARARDNLLRGVGTGARARARTRRASRAGRSRGVDLEQAICGLRAIDEVGECGAFRVVGWERVRCCGEQDAPAVPWHGARHLWLPPHGVRLPGRPHKASECKALASQARPAMSEREWAWPCGAL